MPTVTLRLSARPAHVRTARMVAAAMARRSGVDEDLLDDIRLAVGEACARAVHLHERYAADQPVTVDLVDGESFSVVVQDVAPVPAPRHPARSFASVTTERWTEPDRLGLAILGAVVDDLLVEPTNGGTGTRVQMTWPVTSSAN